MGENALNSSSRKPRKIVHLISQRPDSTGSGYYVQNILRLSSRAGFRNQLIAGVPVEYQPQLDCIDESNCTFVTFGGGQLDFPVPGMSDVMPYESTRFSQMSQADLENYEDAFSKTLQRVLAHFSPDIIHSHHLWIATAVARRTAPEIPLVTSCHSTDLRQFLMRPHLGERVLEGCQAVDRVLALSHEQCARIQELYGVSRGRIDIVGAGFDEELFTWRKKENSTTQQVLYAGKLSFSKGVDWLLRCLTKMENCPMHLHLAGSGSGEEERTCLELAARLGSRVTVHGRITQVELSSLMKKCHIFILPSFYEGLPLVLLEALASGCRIITTTLPGCLELLGQKSSDIVEFVELPFMKEVDRPLQQDSAILDERLSEALEIMYSRVLAKPTLDEAEVSKIVQHFGWQQVFKRIENSYLRCLGDKVPGPLHRW